MEANDKTGEIIPLWENPAFDTSYDTFHDNQDGSQSQIMVTLPDSTAQDEEDQYIKAATADSLMETLPSTQMRKLRGLARPGDVRQRMQSKKEILNAFEEETGDGNGATTSSWEPMSAGAFVSDSMVDANVTNEMSVEGLKPADTINFRETTMSMRAKKSIRRTVSRKHKPKNVSGWTHFKYSVSTKWDRFKNGVKGFFMSFDLWGSHLKQIQGIFGTGVLSYFTFLRWLFYLNVIMSVLTIMFMVVPQITYEPSTNHSVAFTGKELLTGEGWFADTKLYYGSYTNNSIPVPGSTPYNLPQAYLFVGGGYLLLCVIILVHSMAVSYRNNYVIGGEHFDSFIAKLFSSWDYAIVDRQAALIKSQSIFTDLVESLNERKRKIKLTSYEMCCLLFTRILTNIIVLALMAGSAYLIRIVSDGSVEMNTAILTDILPAFTISGLNLIIPFAFRIIASMENYESPKTVITISLARTIVLKLASLGVYVVSLHTQVTCSHEECNKIVCWETWVGALFYKLVIMDFLFIMISTFFGEFVRRILAVYIGSCRERLGIPGFDISRNVLDLIYAQGVCWLGTFYCPLLPLINVIKLLIIFYTKRYSVTRNCRPSMRPFKASKMNLLFLLVLGIMLMFSLVVMGYVIIRLKPSDKCGPFRGKDTIYQLVIEIINNDLGLTLKEIILIVSSASLVTAFVFVLGLLAYYFKLRKSSAEKKIKLLKEQIALAGQDKLYLIRKLRELIKNATPETLPGALAPR